MSEASGNPEPFEAQLSALEEIVEELEGGDLALDRSLARYREGVERLRACYAILRQAEEEVRILSRDENGELVEEPFSGEDA